MARAYVEKEGDWVDDAIKAYSLGYYEDDEYAIPIERFDSAPTIDIVRCQDCKHWVPTYESIRRCVEMGGMPTNPDDFCSYGERKKSE